MSARAIGGLAALLLAAAPAAGRDIDARRDAIGAEKARPCPEQGPGFVRLPGHATCLRLSGRVAADLAVRSRARETRAVPGTIGHLDIDTRTATEFGEVRTFVRAGNGRR